MYMKKLVTHFYCFFAGHGSMGFLARGDSVDLFICILFLCLAYIEVNRGYGKHT